MKTKADIMQQYWNEHGCASSAAGMAYEIRRRFPNKNAGYREECSAFLKKKMEELKANNRLSRHSDIAIKDVSIVDENNWKAIRESLTYHLTSALKGMRYEFQI